MKASHMCTLARYVLNIVVAAALLTGCGGSQPPIGVPGAMPQSRRAIARAADRSGYKVTGPLLYVTNLGAVYNNVRV